jgi:hypothetical protein
MSTQTNAAPAVETRPAARPAPAESIPANPDDPCGVDNEIIEEIEEIGRRYAGPQK